MSTVWCSRMDRGAVSLRASDKLGDSVHGHVDAQRHGRRQRSVPGLQLAVLHVMLRVDRRERPGAGEQDRRQKTKSNPARNQSSYESGRAGHEQTIGEEGVLRLSGCLRVECHSGNNYSFIADLSKWGCPAGWRLYPERERQGASIRTPASVARHATALPYHGGVAGVPFITAIVAKRVGT